MKIGIAGAGAVGSYFGAVLQKAGHQVTFLARGNHLIEMEKNGLTVSGEEESLHTKTAFTDDINDLSKSDLILFCVKSNDTEQMARQLHPILSKDALLLTMQNGVSNEETLCEIFGADRILSSATYIQASIEQPGKVNQNGRVKLVMGELDSSTREACSTITSLFQEASIDTKQADNILEKKWRKLLWNITFNPLSAIVNARVGEVLDDELLRNTAESICAEAIEVAMKSGITLDANQTISTIFSNAERAREHKTSMLQDRLEGKSMEVEAMCGYVFNKGKESNVPTPSIQAAYSILNYMNENKG